MLLLYLLHFYVAVSQFIAALPLYSTSCSDAALPLYNTLRGIAALQFLVHFYVAI
jgi:hypothetical protein